MSDTTTGDALAYCARIRDLILHHSGGRADAEALRKFMQLSRAVSRSSGDRECAELLRTAEQYATDLFSATAHYAWGRGKTSGADILRLCILGKLDVVRERLNELYRQAASAELDVARKPRRV